MDKKLIPILITSISIAIIGLIAVQIYWINSAITLKQEEFVRNANLALHNVVDKLEKDEALSRLRSHKEGKFLFFDEDSLGELSLTIDNIAQSLEDSIHKHIVFKEIIKTNDSIDIKIIEEQDGKKSTRHVISNAGEKEWTEEEKALAHEQIELRIEYQESDDELEKLHEHINIDSIVRERMVHKTAFVGDIVNRLMEVNLFEKITDRIDASELEKLLTEELNNKGISTQFDFGVYQTNGKAVIVSNENDGKIRDSSFKTKLFPNDIVDSNSFLKIHFPQQRSFLVHQIWWMLLLSGFIVVAIIVVFISAIKTIISQKEVSEIKNDFINNMTHELKTPISTISLACEALSDDSIAETPGVSSRYIKMIDDENKRLGLLVENVLQSAIFDKGEFKLKPEELDIHDIISSVVGKLEMQIKKRGGSISENLQATRSVLKFDRVHLSNVVSNLIDNAIKYSEDKPEIVVKTSSNETSFIVSVTDNGIGISDENQKKIFDKLYRVPTGNLHNAKGFGLGLSYVKIITEKHRGTVSVISTPGKGSTFTIEIPFKNE